MQTDLSAATPAFPGVPITSLAATSDVAAGSVHLAVPFDENWKLDLAGQPVVAHPGFGVLTAFDVDSAGSASLHYQSPSSRTVALVGQAVLWLIALLLASRIQAPARLRRLAGRRPPFGEGDAVIDLEADAIAWPTETGDVPPFDETEAAAPRVPASRFDDETAWVDEMFDDVDPSPHKGARP